MGGSCWDYTRQTLLKSAEGKHSLSIFKTPFPQEIPENQAALAERSHQSMLPAPEASLSPWTQDFSPPVRNMWVAGKSQQRDSATTSTQPGSIPYWLQAKEISPKCRPATSFTHAVMPGVRSGEIPSSPSGTTSRKQGEPQKNEI